MINIITKNDNKDVIMDLASYFNIYVTARDFGVRELQALKEIDGADLLDKKTGLVKTKFGLTSIDFLSTGCKSVLVYLYLYKLNDFSSVLNLTMCGYNAIDMVFHFAEELNDNKTVFLLQHQNRLSLVKDRTYCINGSLCKNLADGVSIYG